MSSVLEQLIHFYILHITIPQQFEHVDDCTFCQHLFLHFTLPNGKVMHFYRQGGVKFSPSDVSYIPPAAPHVLDHFTYSIFPAMPAHAYPDLQDKVQLNPRA